MNRIPMLARLAAVIALCLAAITPVATNNQAAAHPGAGPNHVSPTLFKDGEDDDGGDDSGGDDSGGGGDDSGGDDSGGGGDDSGGDDSGGSDNSGSGGGGSDDSVDDSGDDSGSDDPGGDDSVDDSGDDSIDDDGSDNSGSGSDDSGDDSVSDDVVLFDVADDSDGNQKVIEDDDGTDDTDGFRRGEVVVRLQPGASIDDFNTRHRTTLVAAIPGRDLYLVQLPEAEADTITEREFADDGDVRWTELNYVNQAPEGRPGYFFVSGAAEGEMGEAYAPQLLGYADAQTCGTGKSVVVAVLDSGIDREHPAIAKNLAKGSRNILTGTSDVSDIGNGKDDDGDGLVDEMVGHGTHVAGIILQVAPKARILPVKVLSSDGVGDAFYVAAGIHYAVDQGAQVINLSLSSTYDSRVVAEAVADANERGVVVVAAAGNGATDRILEFPAANTGVISVAATDEQDRKSEFSNFGDAIDLAAPGVNIMSALPGGKYASWSGTSMAAPFVSGAAALLASENVDWTSPEITKRLESTAKAIDDLNPDFNGGLGVGRLDVKAAMGCDTTQSASLGTPGT